MDGFSEYQFALLIAIGSAGMLLLAGTIALIMVFYQKRIIQEQLKRQQLELDYQQKMMQATLESQESERRKLAANLHDSIGGMLSTIRMGISTIGRLLPDQRSSVDQTKQMLDDTISSVRKISMDLMPVTLEKFGLVQGLKELCEQISNATLLPIQLYEQQEMILVKKTDELMIFRIVQELLNNAIKHSQASEVKVTIGNDNGLHISVEDNGIGFNVQTQRTAKRIGKGLGFYSIENRVGLLGAKLEFDHQAKGIKITLILPEYEKRA